MKTTVLVVAGVGGLIAALVVPPAFFDTPSAAQELFEGNLDSRSISSTCDP